MIEQTKEYKAFIESVKKNLTLDNSYIQAHEPERDTFEEVDDEDGRHGYPYHMSDKEALELATDDLLADKNDLEEFITGYTEYLDLLKVIIERARWQNQRIVPNIKNKHRLQRASLEIRHHFRKDSRWPNGIDILKHNGINTALTQF